VANKRRRVIADTTPEQLAVVVGLPRPAHNAAKIAIEEAFPRWRVISEPFPEGRERIYSFDEPVERTLRRVCDFASEQAELPIPRPARLVLLYVAAPGEDRLFEGFGYAALPVRIDDPGWHWPHGKHWSADTAVTHRLLLDALAATANAPLHDLRLRLERAEPCDALLLPPRNFEVVDEGSLQPRFDRLLREGGFMAAVFDDLASRHFAFNELKDFFKHVPANSGVFRLDKRGLIFASAPRGQHGAMRVQDVEAIDELRQYRLLLEGLYRFGTPLRSGFQHDVQRQNASLVKEKFYCAARHETIEISASHANIFANDVVR
jgi:hypothetical protein